MSAEWINQGNAEIKSRQPHAALDGDVRAKITPILDRRKHCIGRRVTVCRLSDGMTRTARTADDFELAFSTADALAASLLSEA